MKVDPVRVESAAGTFNIYQPVFVSTSVPLLLPLVGLQGELFRLLHLLVHLLWREPAVVVRQQGEAVLRSSHIVPFFKR